MFDQVIAASGGDCFLKHSVCTDNIAQVKTRMRDGD